MQFIVYTLCANLHNVSLAFVCGCAYRDNAFCIRLFVNVNVHGTQHGNVAATNYMLYTLAHMFGALCSGDEAY